MTLQIRAAQPADAEPLAILWWSGWKDGHAAVLPEALAKLRTLDSFRDRMNAALTDVRVIGEIGHPLAFHLIKGDELYQFYVSSEARGTGVATALIQDAEAIMRARGIRTAWLACAVGNDRAARFYEKSGWHRTGTQCVPTETSAGPYPLHVWRYEKSLGVA
jgi:GNAT superfamily N-acetyltransferase